MAPEPVLCDRCKAEVKRDALVEHYRRFFALQQQARDLGRDIITGGSGWRGSFYGAVVATTYPYPSALGSRSREDSWRCHHRHEDEFGALECALSEVRRLKAGGDYQPCADGPDCPDDWCKWDWARLDRAAKG